jgi:hypothetical protein
MMNNTNDLTIGLSVLIDLIKQELAGFVMFGHHIAAAKLVDVWIALRSVPDYVSIVHPFPQHRCHGVPFVCTGPQCCSNECDIIEDDTRVIQEMEVVQMKVFQRFVDLFAGSKVCSLVMFVVPHYVYNVLELCGCTLNEIHKPFHGDFSVGNSDIPC